jgi:MFS family permease
MFKKSLRDFLKNPILTIPGILFYLLTGGISYYNLDPAILDQLEQAGATGDIQSISTEVAAFFSAFLLLLIITIFLKPLVDVWSNLMAKDIVLENEPNFRKNFRNSFKYYWRMFSISVLIGLIFIIALIIFTIILTPLIISAINGSTTGITASSIMVVIFVLIVIFMWISFMPVSVALVFEDLSITKSFSKGFRFGVKNFFPILGSIVPIIIVMLVLSIILYQYPHAANIVYAYLAMFITIYITNLYNHKNPPVYDEVSPYETKDENNNENIIENENNNLE